MSRRAALLVNAMVAAAVSACSLVSGWSDLQGGRSAGKGTVDGAAPLDGSSSGEDAGADSSAGALAVACGATRCPTGQGCCVEFGNGSSQCGGEPACASEANIFLRCSSAATCPASAPACCYDFADVATCLAACGPGLAELCDPAEAQPCSSGKACTNTAPGLSSRMSCQ